jgi:hypothetical protein
MIKEHQINHLIKIQLLFNITIKKTAAVQSSDETQLLVNLALKEQLEVSHLIPANHVMKSISARSSGAETANSQNRHRRQIIVKEHFKRTEQRRHKENLFTL